MAKKGVLHDSSSALAILVLIGILFVHTFIFGLAYLLTLSQLFHFSVDQILTLGQTLPLSEDQLNALRAGAIVQDVFLFIMPAVVFAYLFKGPDQDYLKIAQGGTAVSFTVIFLTIIALLPFVEWLGKINENIHLPSAWSAVKNYFRETEKQIEALERPLLMVSQTNYFLFNVVAVALFPAVSEEFIFRGCLQQILIKGFKSPHVGIAVGAVIFSAIHMQFSGFIPRLFLGLLLGYIFWMGKSLWLSAFAHFVNNFVGVFADFAYTRKWIQIDPEKEIFHNLLYPMVSVVISAVFIYFLIRRWRKQEAVEVTNEQVVHA